MIGEYNRKSVSRAGWITAIFIVFVLAGFNFAQAAWTEPTKAPPEDNIAKPLNESTNFDGANSNITGLWNALQIKPCSNDDEIMVWNLTQGWHCAVQGGTQDLISVLDNGADASEFTGFGTPLDLNVRIGQDVIGNQANFYVAGGEISSKWLHATADGDNSIIGRLGIGTATPNTDVKLEVQDNSSPSKAIIRITNTNATAGNPELQLQYGVNAGDHWGIYVDRGISGSGGTKELRFWNVSDRVKIATGGTVTATDFCLTGSGGKCLSANTAASFAGLATPGTFNGSQGGYTGMNDKCNTAFPSSHICSANEMIVLARTPSVFVGLSDYAWINTGTAGFRDNYLINDCTGWTSSAGTAYGSIWLFTGASTNGGSVWLSACSSQRQIACCR